MPITSFGPLQDGLQPAQRRRDHFIVNTDLTDDRLWIPYAEGVWFQPCHFDVGSGGFTLVLKALPGARVGTHYHVSTVHGYTLQGRWRYLEHDWVATAGTFIFEPAGEAHTLVVPDDASEPMVAIFIVAAGIIFTDGGRDGKFGGYEDGFTLLELARKHYREVGLDPSSLDAMIR